MGDIIFFLAIVFLLLCSALFSGLTIGILSLNHYELKRKAQLGSKSAKVVYPIRSLGNQLMVTLLIGNVTVNAGITAILDTRTNGLLAVIITTVIVVIFGEILPMAYLGKHSLEVTARIAPVLKKLILLLSPIAKPMGRTLDKWLGREHPTIYSKEELYKIFEGRELSKESDISTQEVNIIRHALSFGDKLVREIMTPRRVVKSVLVDDLIGPILLDELHKSGYSRFPVLANKNGQEFVGTLYIHDLVGTDIRGSVRDFMRKDVYFVHEEKPLDFALRVFLRTNHHLLIVVNTFEEFVGVVSLEDVVEEILGKQIVDEFDQHRDLRAVAKSLAEADSKDRQLKTSN